MLGQHRPAGAGHRGDRRRPRRDRHPDLPQLEELEAEGFGRDADDGALTDRLLKGEIARRLAERAREVQGSSTHVARAMVLAEPPDIGAGEITAKGNLNARKVLDRRKALLDRLYDDADPATITF